MPRPRSLSFALVCAVGAAVFTGCLGTPLPERDWVALESRHFEIVTTLAPEQATRLAVELEAQRVAAEMLLGQSIAAAPRRTRVVAYDGRGTERPFRLPMREPSYLLSRPEGDVIVLRGGAGWEKARTQLRVDYARRLIWNALARPLPPWLEEGLAQVASTTRVGGGGVEVGALRADHVRALRSEHWIGLDRLTSARDLAGWSDLEREVFEAEAWALVHYLKFDASLRAAGGDPLRDYVAALVRGVPEPAAARKNLGEGLRQKLWRHVRATSFASLVLRVGPLSRPSEPRPLAQDEILLVLGELSLEVGRPAQAQSYFEAARKRGADGPRLAAGLGSALVAADATGEGSSAIEAALAAQPDPADPGLLLARARALLAAAEAADSAAQRSALAERASAASRQLLAQKEDDVAALVVLARASLHSGELAEASAAVERVQRQRPADLGLQALAVEIALARGETRLAQQRALRLLTLARSRSELAAARTLLERSEEPVALR